MDCDGIAKFMKKRLRKNISWAKFLLLKSPEDLKHVSTQNNYLEMLKRVMGNEYILVFQELKPYLELPPDGPEH